MSRETAQERIWLTADRQGVRPEGHPEAATLLYSEGKPITAEDAERFGLAGGRIGGQKMAAAGANKRAAAGANKARRSTDG